MYCSIISLTLCIAIFSHVFFIIVIIVYNNAVHRLRFWNYTVTITYATVDYFLISKQIITYCFMCAD